MGAGRREPGEGCPLAARSQLGDILKVEGPFRREAKRLKALQDENARLKRMLADSMLDIATLKRLLGNKC